MNGNPYVILWELELALGRARVDARARAAEIAPFMRAIRSSMAAIQRAARQAAPAFRQLRVALEQLEERG